MKILIQDIPQGCISSENFLIGVVVHYKGNKIDLEIDDQKLAERILLEVKRESVIKRVYVAGKINDKAVEYIKNMHNMMMYAEKVRQMGYSVFVPCLDVLMGMMFGCYGYKDYFDNNLCWLEVADIMFVCPGWETSTGTMKEMNRAEELGIPIVYNLEDLEKL